MGRPTQIGLLVAGIGEERDKDSLGNVSGIQCSLSHRSVCYFFFSSFT